MKTIRIVNRKKVIYDMIAIAVLAMFVLLPLEVVRYREKSNLCIASFLVNGVFFLFGLFYARKKESISLGIVYWIFMFFFMYFAPLIQYLKSKFPWRGSFTDVEILTINTVIFLFNIAFLLGRFFAKKIKVIGFTNVNVSEFLCSDFSFGRKSRILMTLLACLMAGYSFSKTGLLGIVVSRVQATRVFYSGSNSAIELIVESVIPAFLAYIVAEAAQNVAARKEKPYRFILLLVCLLICFFPTSLPRYKTITIYGTVFLVMFPGLKKGAKFFWIFILALFFAFPIMNGFRHMLSMENLREVFDDGILSVYTDADYDAYRMLGSAISYTGNYGAEWGFPLLGALLFFVPRAIWPSKPGGSGAMLIRSEFGADTVSNVSCPYIGEGYLNFGFIGMILFGIFLGIWIYKLDRFYHDFHKEKDYVVFSPYLFIVFMLFFMLRGDLLSSFAYLCGFVVTGFLLRTAAKYI